MRRRASVCVKQGEDAAPLLCAREMRDDLRRDNDTLVGCLLGWANHSLYICPFLFFLFPFFLPIPCCHFPISYNCKALPCLALWSPRCRLVHSNEWLAMSRLAALNYDLALLFDYFTPTFLEHSLSSGKMLQ